MRSHVVLTAATLLHLCTLQLLTTGSAAYYSCSSKEDCNYEGCNDNACASTSSYCKNGVWDHLCVSSHKQPIDVFSAAFSNLDICLVPNSLVLQISVSLHYCCSSSPKQIVFCLRYLTCTISCFRNVIRLSVSIATSSHKLLSEIQITYIHLLLCCMIEVV